MKTSSRICAFALVSMLMVASCVEAGPASQGTGSDWGQLEQAPLSARENAHGFWLDPEVLIVGGSDAAPCPPGADCVLPDVPALVDGAMLDVSTGEWRKISPAPIPIGGAAGAVVDDVVYMWLDGFQGRPGSETAFLAYDTTKDEWSRLPLPESPPAFAGLVSTEGQLVLYQHTQERGVQADLMFDLGEETWSTLPPDPLQSAYDRSMVWTGEFLVLLGIELGTLKPSGPNFYSAASFDPDSAKWTRYPQSETLGWNPIWYSLGGVIVNPSVGSADGGRVNNWGQSYPFGGILQLDPLVWLPLPDVPSGFGEVVGYGGGAGNYLLSHEGWILDYPKGEWFAPPAPPLGPPDGATVVLTDTSLIVWGGVVWDSSEGRFMDSGWELALND